MADRRPVLRALARRAVGAAVVGAVTLAVVVAVEIQLARSGDRLPELKLALDRPGSGPRVVWLGDSTAVGERFGEDHETNVSNTRS